MDWRIWLIKFMCEGCHKSIRFTIVSVTADDAIGLGETLAAEWEGAGCLKHAMTLYGLNRQYTVDGIVEADRSAKKI